ncbi:MAG: hypothetical protein AAFY20_25040 [Cyanobacteria bacterium J06639_14]
MEKLIDYCCDRFQSSDIDRGYPQDARVFLDSKMFDMKEVCVEG